MYRNVEVEVMLGRWLLGAWLVGGVILALASLGRRWCSAYAYAASVLVVNHLLALRKQWAFGLKKRYRKFHNLLNAYALRSAAFGPVSEYSLNKAVECVQGQESGEFELACLGTALGEWVESSFQGLDGQAGKARFVDDITGVLGRK